VGLNVEPCAQTGGGRRPGGPGAQTPLAERLGRGEQSLVRRAEGLASGPTPMWRAFLAPGATWPSGARALVRGCGGSARGGGGGGLVEAGKSGR